MKKLKCTFCMKRATRIMQSALRIFPQSNLNEMKKKKISILKLIDDKLS